MISIFADLPLPSALMHVTTTGDIIGPPLLHSSVALPFALQRLTLTAPLLPMAIRYARDLSPGSIRSKMTHSHAVLCSAFGDAAFAHGVGATTIET